jgi:hypothetical protein
MDLNSKISLGLPYPFGATELMSFMTNPGCCSKQTETMTKFYHT